MKRVGLDTMVFIYYAEGHPKWGPPARDLFARAEREELELATSVLTVTEVLTGYRKKKDAEAERSFLGILQFLRPSLLFVPVTLEVADRAATLRAHYGLRTPDAIHLASALAAGANSYVSNDQKLKRVKEIAVRTLDDFTK